jgi:hypothetical protein
MKYEDIKEFSQRCDEHPDHQRGMPTGQMIALRLGEEIDELRAYIEQRTWVGLTDEEIKAINAQVSQIPPIDYTTTTYAKAVEAKLKEKNT